MKYTIWTGTCAAMMTIATAGMLAQTPAPQTPAPQTPAAQTPAPQTPAPQAAPSTAGKVTVTGCLKAAPTLPGDTAAAANPNPTGTAGSASSATAGTSGTADAKFILTGATASPADAGSAQTYRLIANPTALNEHVGKKLELVGTIDKTSTADPKDPSAAAPAFRVESGKIIAASCSE